MLMLSWELSIILYFNHFIEVNLIWKKILIMRLCDNRYITTTWIDSLVLYYVWVLIVRFIEWAKKVVKLFALVVNKSNKFFICAQTSN